MRSARVVFALIGVFIAHQIGSRGKVWWWRSVIDCLYYHHELSNIDIPCSLLGIKLDINAKSGKDSDSPISAEDCALFLAIDKKAVVNKDLRILLDIVESGS